MVPDHPTGLLFRIFLVDGNPNGLRTVERANWTGRAIAFSRPEFRRARLRQDLHRTGVYVLVREAEDATRGFRTTKVYVGEGGEPWRRIRRHLKRQDFPDWQRVVLFTSKDRTLHVSTAKYIESRLIKIGNEVNPDGIHNKRTPKPPKLAEAERSVAESFLREMLRMYPLLGVHAFQKPDRYALKGPTLSLGRRWPHAHGRETPNGFLVLKGSRLRPELKPSAKDRVHKYIPRTRTTLLQSRVIEREGRRLVFTADHEFGSPSRAAEIILGTPVSGQKAWRDERGRTLEQIQTSE